MFEKIVGILGIGEHRGLYGVLLFDRFMKHSIHNNLTNLDYSCASPETPLTSRQRSQGKVAANAAGILFLPPTEVPKAEVAEFGGEQFGRFGRGEVLQSGAERRL